MRSNNPPPSKKKNKKKIITCKVHYTSKISPSFLVLANVSTPIPSANLSMSVALSPSQGCWEPPAMWTTILSRGNGSCRRDSCLTLCCSIALLLVCGVCVCVCVCVRTRVCVCVCVCVCMCACDVTQRPSTCRWRPIQLPDLLQACSGIPGHGSGQEVPP